MMSAGDRMMSPMTQVFRCNGVQAAGMLGAHG